MKDFVYSYPTKVYFGVGVAEKALKTELLPSVNKVMLAYGGGSVKANGIYNQICTILKALGKNVIEFSGIMSNPTYEKTKQGAELARKEGVDYILALGGGSVIDCSKIIAAQAMLDEDIWDMEFESRRLPISSIPVGAIVTASGTGAEMNGGAVITNTEKQIKTGLLAFAPKFAVLDSVYTISVPPSQVFSGAFDTLSHAMETYMGNSDNDNVSDEVALAIVKNTVTNMKRLFKNVYDLEARGNLMWDSAMAENGILKIGRATDFQAHQIEHQLGAFTDCNHGQALAVILPAYYEYILDSAKDKLKRMAFEVFGCNTAEKGLLTLKAFIKECGLPTTLSSLKSNTVITPELLKKVAFSTNIIKTNAHQLTSDDIYEILIKCL